MIDSLLAEFEKETGTAGWKKDEYGNFYLNIPEPIHDLANQKVLALNTALRQILESFHPTDFILLVDIFNGLGKERGYQIVIPSRTVPQLLDLIIGDASGQSKADLMEVFNAKLDVDLKNLNIDGDIDQWSAKSAITQLIEAGDVANKWKEATNLDGWVQDAEGDLMLTVDRVYRSNLDRVFNAVTGIINEILDDKSVPAITTDNPDNPRTFTLFIPARIARVTQVIDAVCTFKDMQSALQNLADALLSGRQK